MSNFVKIHPVGAELFLADKWLDRHDESDSRFCSFVNVPKKRCACVETVSVCPSVTWYK